MKRSLEVVMAAFTLTAGMVQLDFCLASRELNKRTYLREKCRLLINTDRIANYDQRKATKPSLKP